MLIEFVDRPCTFVFANFYSGSTAFDMVDLRPTIGISCPRFAAPLFIHPLVTVLMIFVGSMLSGLVALMLVLPLMGAMMVIGETLGTLAPSLRLCARHRHVRALRTRQASVDLDIARERRGAPTPNAAVGAKK